MAALSMSMNHSPPQPRVQRERERFEQLERDSRERINLLNQGMPPSRVPRQRRSRSGSMSSSSGSPDHSQQQQQQQQQPLSLSLQLQNLPKDLCLAIPTTVATSSSSYPNYYDYSEHTEDLNVVNNKHNTMASTAMQVPIHSQQPPQQRLVDTKGPVTTAQIAHAPRGAAQIVTHGSQRGPPRDRPPSYSGSSHNNNTTNNSQSALPDDIILPPNKVDLDAARYRRAQQQESRRERERDRDRPSTRDREARKPSLTNGRPSSSSGMGNPTPAHHHHHHATTTTNNNGRPISPESPLLTPTGPNIQRLPTPSVPNSVLQPLDAKVVEYGTLMAEAQGEMARLDEEMRVLQDRQREAEQRFLDAKTKHDDYRRQYSDVERALRGDFARAMNNNNNNNNGGGGGGFQGRGDHHLDDDDRVPPMPSMPSLQQYGTNTGGPTSRHGSGNLLNGDGAGRPMPPRRMASVQSDMVSQDSVRSHPKRGRFSRLFGV